MQNTNAGSSKVKYKFAALVAGLLVGSSTVGWSGTECRAYRPSNVTYGGLPPVTGYQRDHWIPLCLGGLDTRDTTENPWVPPNIGNVWYEPLREARDKDITEHNVCRYVCEVGSMAIENARTDFKLGNWRKWR